MASANVSETARRRTIEASWLVGALWRTDPLRDHGRQLVERGLFAEL